MTAIDYDDLEKHFGLLRTAPQKYLAMADEFVRENPNHAGGYFHRHYAWEKLGEHQRALDDIETSLRLEPHPTTYRTKGRLLYGLNLIRIEAISGSDRRVQRFESDGSKAMDRCLRSPVPC